MPCTIGLSQLNSNMDSVVMLSVPCNLLRQLSGTQVRQKSHPLHHKEQCSQYASSASSAVVSGDGQ